MGELGDLLELLHGARGNYRSLRATVRVRRDEEAGQVAATSERISTFWVVWPALMRCERQLQLDGETRLAVTVGDGDRWSYRDPRFGVERLEEGLARVELPELSLFDPWQLASDLELEAAPRTTCAGRDERARLLRAGQ